jgi:site-specific DNA recombinase
MRLRCTAYARCSTDRQNPLSTQDQLRQCADFAERQGWEFLEKYVYIDEAVTGARDDRPGLQRLLAAAFSSPRPFDCILVDDTSRLSRNLADALRLIERLKFAGIRVIAVSQGIDSQNQQADVLLTVHGLVDSLYIQEIAQKTRRGLEGKMLRGLHAGGRTYGYSSATSPDGVRLEVNEAEATVVVRIFQMSADGHSLKTIAKALNAETVPAPRPRKNRPAAG